jgi:hypothetical protein
MRQAKYSLEKKPMNVWTVDKQHQWFPLYEANVPVVVQFFHAYSLLPCGWHNLDTAHRSVLQIPPAKRVSLCDLEFTASVTVGRVSTARLLGMCGNHG